MKQNNAPKNADGQRAAVVQNSAESQIAAAKAKQKADALRRSKQPSARKSMAAASVPQSEVTERPPNLYRAPKINPPATVLELAKLLQQELSKIEAAQAFLLTLWEQQQAAEE